MVRLNKEFQIVMKTSFKQTVSSEIGYFLYSIGFSLAPDNNRILNEELVSIANMISDYFEEGTKLYPEIIVTNDMSKVNHFLIHPFERTQLHEGMMVKALKMCAPLSQNGWTIFYEINDNNVVWGVVNSEEHILSPILKEQMVINAVYDSKEFFIRNVGGKTVEFCSASGKSYSVSLSLSDSTNYSTANIDRLCSYISKDCPKSREMFSSFLSKQISKAIQIGHGNLIAVIDKDKNVPDILKQGVDFRQVPLEIYEGYMSFWESKDDIVRHERLRKQIDLLIPMLNHDGIALFSSNGRLLGYHFIVDNSMQGETPTLGGSRHKAYQKLCASNEFICVLMKTQEGAIEINNK